MKRKSITLNFYQVETGLCGQKGLSLVELVVTLAIISVSFLTMFAAQMSSFTSLDKSLELKDAKTFATRILEDKYRELIYKILEDTDPEAKFNSYVDNCKGKALSDVTSNDTTYGCYGVDKYDNYKVAWRLESGKDSVVPIGLEGTVLLELRVYWEENNQQHSFSLANYLSCTYVVRDDLNTICPTPRDPVAP